MVEALCQFSKLQYSSRFPHPVTFAGMIEMGSTYLPVDSDWYRYVNAAEDKFNELQEEQKLTLMKVAEEACEYAKDDRSVFALAFIGTCG